MRRFPFTMLSPPVPLAAFVLGLSLAAAPPPTVSAAPPPLASYVPQSARLFVDAPDLHRLHVALTRSHAWRLLPLLTGGGSGAGASVDLPDALVGFLGIRADPRSATVGAAGWGLAADSWLALPRAVWLVRPARISVLNKWFPPARRISAGSVGKARYFRMQGGVMVAVADGVIAVSRHDEPDSLWQQVLACMAGVRADVLQQARDFRRLQAYLPDDLLATVYVTSDSAGMPAATTSLFRPDIQRAVIGLYEGQGRLDVAIRAALSSPHPKPKLTPSVIARLFELPQTTILATATTFELDKLYAKAAKDQTAGTLARYAALLGVIERGAQPLPEPERHLGPHAIAVWGQELRADSITPQIALMIECDDSPAVRQRLFRVTQRITRLIRWLDPSLTQANLTIQQSRHFGTTIYHVPLTAYAAASKLPMARLLGGADPAWTISNGWLIVALDRPHVERILDAQLGLFPTLANVRDVQPLRRRPVNRSILSVVQPDLAAAALDKWLAAAASGAASPLNPSWWRAGSASADDPAKVLGIRLSEPSPAGAAAVASVEPGSPAAERLQPGDRIVAVDGTVLALTAAAADLRARLRQSTTATGPTLRFERGGVFQEVVLPRPDNDDAPTAQGIDPTAAVRELAALARALQFASLAVDASEPMYYSAILSLRFNADHAAPAPVHEDRPTRRNE